MNTAEIKQKEKIESALAAIATGDFLENAKHLLAVLGYCSERTLELPGTAEDFIQRFPARHKNTETEKEFIDSVESVELVFHVTSAEIAPNDEPTLFEAPAFEAGYVRSFLFFTVALKDKDYPRGKYAQFTREVNKRFMMPIVVLFRVKDRLTIGFVGRRQHQLDPDRDVLEQVSLIKDIRLNKPHPAHRDILFELSLAECAKWMADHKKQENFDGLLAAWLAQLDTEELNKKFYRELFNWFEWAVAEGKFPTDKNRTLEPEEHVIRLITRLLFVWFIKEKGLIADELFNETHVSDLLKDYDREDGDSYYRAVLQNLFFATLNTEIEKRGFSEGGTPRHRNFSLYRYKDQITDSDKLRGLFEKTPFINGGLFDCLDSFKATRDGGYRIDCFSDVHYKKLRIPNYLFFDDTRGLIPLLEHYKFTVEENTPIEQDVALDPELLGRVFENLLAAYNPETGATVRKQTGSYYTPRPIVDYMVEEALVATLAEQVSPTDGNPKFWDERLRYLFDYAQVFDDASERFDDNETDRIVRAISELKILDPAVGSGAFPMGVLHKLTLALRRLDPDNSRWEQLQRDRAGKRAQAAFTISNQRERDVELAEISDTFERYRDSDFGRKLYLIQNSIFGVDIQSIACQIAKLRFFISLAIEQVPDRDADNFGIKPLPNLETRFVAANTLIGLEEDRTLTSQKAKALEAELGDNRERHFHATTRPQKLACKRADRKLRRALATELKDIGMPADDADKIAHWDPYDQNGSADWFDSEWMFGIAEGFDVVIGNPPYVRQEKIKELKPTLKNQYDCYTGTADLYVYFYERGFQLLRDNGVLAYISSNKYFRATYGKKLRDFLARQSTVSQLIDFGAGRVFAASVDTSIITISKTYSEGNHLRALSWEPGPSIDEFGTVFRAQGFTMPQNALTADGWRLASPAVFNLLEKLRKAGKPLGEYVQGRFYMGIKTGLNKAFVVDRETRDRLVAEHPSSSEVLKPFLRGRDVKRWQMNYQDLWLIFTRRGIDIDNYPAIKKHLSQYRKQLEPAPKDWPLNKPWPGRKAGPYKWYEIQDNIAYWQEFEQSKIIYPDIYQHQSFTVDTTGFYCGNTCYFIPTDETWLCGLLNSRSVEWFYSLVSNRLGGGALRGFSDYMKQIPIPNAETAQKTSISKLVDQILAAKRTDPDADVSELENTVDQLVYLLYDLTDEETDIVEEAKNV